MWRSLAERVGADDEQKSGLCVQSQGLAGVGPGGDGCDNLQRAPVKDRYLIGRPIADVAELAARIEDDGMGFVAAPVIWPASAPVSNIHHLGPCAPCAIKSRLVDGVHGQG